ncbi:hypothetical protein ACRDNQ_09810 [Palleronia sp. KMU-117]|uniref:hypothetical protein n=1 Tax=Palleronia sp. KMU-117 TaxID=3434108 RepID=UPI003D725048
MVRQVLQKVVLSPHLWLAAAAISIAGSFVVDYIDAQRTADRALALRQGPPPVAEIQGFEPARHVGPAREVLLRAEADLGDPIVVTLGPEDSRQTAVIYPLFPVSDRGREAIARRLADDGTLGSMRPAPRPDPESLTRTRSEALGIILHWADLPTPEGDIDPASLVARSFGPGSHGSAVEINGERVAPGDMALVVKGAMAARNLAIANDFIAVSPYVDGRLTALAQPPSSGLQRTLFWGGIVLGLGAMLLSVRSADVFAPRTPAPRPPGEQDRRMSPGRTAKAQSRFQTIPTQDEIYAAAQARDARETEPGPTRKILESVERFRTRR